MDLISTLDSVHHMSHYAGTGTMTVASNHRQQDAPQPTSMAALNKFKEPMAAQHVNAMQSLFLYPPSPSCPSPCCRSCLSLCSLGLPGHVVPSSVWSLKPPLSLPPCKSRRLGAGVAGYGHDNVLCLAVPLVARCSCPASASVSVTLQCPLLLLGSHSTPGGDNEDMNGGKCHCHCHCHCPSQSDSHSHSHFHSHSHSCTEGLSCIHMHVVPRAVR